MNLREYINGQRGRAAELARKIGVRPVMVSQWARLEKPVAVRRCLPIEHATAGMVTRRELRPDDWANYWPDLGGEGGHQHDDLTVRHPTQCTQTLTPGEPPNTRVLQPVAGSGVADA